MRSKTGVSADTYVVTKRLLAHFWCSRLVEGHGAGGVGVPGHGVADLLRRLLHGLLLVLGGHLLLHLGLEAARGRALVAEGFRNKILEERLINCLLTLPFAWRQGVPRTCLSPLGFGIYHDQSLMRYR